MDQYLAAKYMSGPKADAILAASDTKKSRKRKRQAEQAQIVDEDELISRWKEDQPEDVESAPTVERGGIFRANTKSSWKSLGPELPKAEDTDEKPLLSGAVSKAREDRDLSSQRSKGRRAEQAPEDDPSQFETVYRDSSGRKINTKMEKAEIARKRREEMEKDMQKMEWGKGLVQREDQEKKRKEEEEIARKPMARYADDIEMNEGMRNQMRWNDPAANFLEKNKSRGPSRPKYSGPPPPPNRFSIMPGYRWDGVDRSNGFEKSIFQKQGENKRTTLEGYKWSVEDM